MASINGVNSDLSTLFTSTAINRKSSSNSSLDVNDFLSLIAAQMRYQDMMNPMNDTEFMGQLAQFTTLQSIQDLTAMNSTAYSVGLLGKEVTTAKMVSGQLMVETGIVSGIGLFEGEPAVYIGEKSYSLQEIMVVGKMPEMQAEEPVPEPEPDPESEPEPEPAENP
jgi:flagellar basal-body rod modification protein FlgD